MAIRIEMKSNKVISRFENDLMNKFKSKEYGRKHKRKDFRKDYPDSVFFFVKGKGKITAFGTFRRLTLEFKCKRYRIFGICNILTIQRGKGYGKILIKAMIKHLKRTGKTGLGFCISKNMKFYKKSGMSIKKEFIRRVVYKNPKGKLEPEKNADGFYYEGKDKLITKILSGKSIAYTDLKDW